MDEMTPTPTALLSPDGDTDDEGFAPAPAPLIEGEEELDAEEILLLAPSQDPYLGNW